VSSELLEFQGEDKKLLLQVQELKKKHAEIQKVF
jgi:hypothetical protein